MKKIQASKLKKFDIVECLFSTETINFITLMKGSLFCKITYMSGKSSFCMADEFIEVKRDNFYCITHKVFTNNFKNILQ